MKNVLDNSPYLVEDILTDIQSDEDCYIDFHLCYVDYNNKLILISTYYGDDEDIIKDQEQISEVTIKFSLEKLLYMNDDKDNKYRHSLFKFKGIKK